MIACGKCGTRNADGAQFCERCGGFLEWGGVKVEEPTRSAVRAMLDVRDVDVEPGERAVCTVSVYNDGGIVDEYRVSVAGPEPAWCSVQPETLRLMPGTDGTARILFRPPRGPRPGAGTVPFVVTVASTVGGARAEAAGSVTITPFYEVGAVLVPQTSEGVGAVEHSVRIESRGNRPVHVVVSASDPDEKLVCSSVPLELDVEPGRSATATLTVRARSAREPRGGRRLPFQVLVETAGVPPVRIDGATVLLDRPASWWMRWRFSVAAVALLALLGAGATIGFASGVLPWPPLSNRTSSVTPTPGLTPTAAQTGTLKLSRGSIAFGSAQVGTSSTYQQLTVTNGGPGSASVSAVLAGDSAGNFALDGPCTSAMELPANADCQLQVAFGPRSEGPKTARILFVTSNTAAQLPEVTLSGTGQGVPLITFTPPNVAFAITVLTSPAPTAQDRTVTIKNTGTADIVASSISVSDPRSFSIVAGATPAPGASSTCPLTNARLAGGASCSLTIRFTSTTLTTTPVTASLVVNDNLPGGQQIVPLSGTRTFGFIIRPISPLPKSQNRDVAGVEAARSP